MLISLWNDDLRENYPGARDNPDRLDEQLAKEMSLGAMVVFDLDQARALHGDTLSVASLGAVPKPDGSLRVVHDGSNGQHINDCIRFATRSGTRRAATSRRLSRFFPSHTFLSAVNISRAHRLMPRQGGGLASTSLSRVGPPESILQLRRDVRDCLCFLLVVQVDVWVGKAGLLLPPAGPDGLAELRRRPHLADPVR